MSEMIAWIAAEADGGDEISLPEDPEFKTKVKIPTSRKRREKWGTRLLCRSKICRCISLRRLERGIL